MKCSRFSEEQIIGILKELSRLWGSGCHRHFCGIMAQTHQALG
jgi:hypothetical protein